MKFIELSQQEYIHLLRKQKDPVKRLNMKQVAFYAMYSFNPDTKVLMPVDFLPETEHDKTS